MPVHEREEKHEAALDEALTNLPNLLAKRRKMLDEQEEELKKGFEKLEKEKKSLGCGKDSDVIHLNVGGTLMATLRSTLTYVEDSMLAARFSGRWDESIAKDKDGNFFIDQPIELFLPMINFIRNKQCETLLEGAPSSPSLETFNDDELKYGDFKRMVEYFGMTPGIYPVELVDYSTASKERLAVSGTLSTLQLAFNERTVCVLLPSGHFRQIKGFEVKIGDSVNLQLGWVKSPIVGNTDVCSNAQSIVLDLARGGISCQGSLVPVGNTIQNGTFVRCKNFGREWFVDGEKIVGPWEKTLTLQGVVPVISGKGEWAITAVELGP
ncbi:hypothetical protein FisN_16Hu120 [Fistulifera solaris]|uniref:Potassium channel tetramerisation-type BTB domain-containing protein n=1 Tax=Fistulifera solaris TaxID=1519565 RepID=A0A1Z5KT19_FISSO|nr:hypothetical protein FisN_16Hu120 [Fistulifera solaris]|eukprot:GAX29439.1 hypothetical protein FisN_16Hu120 [Fistulifera solaris]